MGSNLNFLNFGNDPPPEGGGGRTLPVNLPLTRQSSVYSLTFDEFQTTVGGIGKDFGSMNMDEFLKNIWSAEENQNIGSSTSGGGVGGQETGNYLQRQGSLTLPRTLSQKTVDEVWREVYGGGSDGGTGGAAGGAGGGFGMAQRQPTLAEVTLEEFLVRAGVVREESQLGGKPNNNFQFFDDLSRPTGNSGIEFGFGLANQNAGLITTAATTNNNQISVQSGNSGLEFGFGLANQNAGLITTSAATTNNNQISVQSANLPLNVNGVRSYANQPVLIPKQPALPYMGISRSRGRIGISENNSTVQHVKLQSGTGMVNLGGNNNVTTVSPAVSSDGVAKSNGDTSSVSPVPFVFNGGLRGRKRAALEKVVERRQRRMIKNRESAARSRARKQAYTMELEAEIAELKEENDELRKKQEEMMEMQKNQQVLEMMNQQKGAKRRSLRRTQTGPW